MTFQKPLVILWELDYFYCFTSTDFENSERKLRLISIKTPNSLLKYKPNFFEGKKPICFPASTRGLFWATLFDKECLVNCIKLISSVWKLIGSQKKSVENFGETSDTGRAKRRKNSNIGDITFFGGIKHVFARNKTCKC